MKTVYIYCHGFASSPGSKKATAFAQRFRERGKELIVPDLEDGDFRKITISRQVEKITGVLNTFSYAKVGLIGSSMGGYLAALVAQMRQEVAAQYLMCPGFHFLERWQERVARDYPDVDGLPAAITVYHYRYDRPMELDTGIFEDARKWDTRVLDRSLPTRIVHGVHDDTVPIQQSRDFAADRSWASLVELDSDHGLLSHMDWIVEDCLNFFSREGV